MNFKSVGIILVLIVVGFVITIRTLVYNGFCVAERRWLNQAELFDVAMQNVFQFYPPQRFRIPFVYSKKITNPIVYTSFDDFVRRNPDCCRMSSTGWKGLQVSFFHRLRGYSGDFVRVEYAADEDEIEPAGLRRLESTVAFFNARDEEYKPNSKNLSFVPMTNCGAVWQGF